MDNTSIVKGGEYVRHTMANVSTKEEHNRGNWVNLMAEGLQDTFDPKLTRGKK